MFSGSPACRDIPETVEGIALSEALSGKTDAPPPERGDIRRCAPLVGPSPVQSAASDKQPVRLPPESVLIANYISADEGQRQNMPEWRGVRTRRHTYVELPGRKPWLLFDNREDPFQMANLVENPAYQSLAEDLREELGRWLEKTRDPFLPRDELIAHFGLEQAFADREHMYD